MNNIIIIGRLVKEAEIRYTTSNKAVANFTIACTRNFKNNDGVYDTDFINCQIWGQPAINMQDYCNKGDLLAVKGALRNESYEVEGQKRYRTYILADRVQYLSAKKDKGTEQQKDAFEQFGEKVENELGNDLPEPEFPW